MISGDSLQWSDDVSEVWGEVAMQSADGTGEVHGAYARREAADSLEVVLGSQARRAWLRQIEDGDTLLLAAHELTRRREVLTATRDVTMVQDEMVGAGDSLVWDEVAETMKVWGTPELWSAKDRMSGDSLTLFLSNQTPEKLELRGNAVVLAPANDTLAHRIQGRDLNAHFVDGELVTVDVVGNGEVVTFEVPEEGRTGKVRMYTAVCAKVTLGVVPDYLFSGMGMRIDGVSEDRPAQLAGLQKGDVVVRIGDIEVADMMGYMEGLSKFEAGETTDVEVLRNGESMVVQVTWD